MRPCGAVFCIFLLVVTPIASAVIVDETEPNNNPSSYNALQPGDIGRGDISSETDVDFWRLNPPPAQIGFFYVDTHVSTSGADSYLKLYYTPDGITFPLVAEDDNGGPGLSSAISGVSLIGGFVFPDVRWGTPTGSGAITPYLLFQCLFDPADSLGETEPNDTPQQANMLGSGMTTGSIGDVDPADYYAFFADTGDIVALLIDTSPLGTAFGGGLAILDRDGSTALADSGTPAKKALGSITLAASGRYFVRVTGGASGGADYRFALNVNGACNSQAADTIFRSAFE